MENHLYCVEGFVQKLIIMIIILLLLLEMDQTEDISKWFFLWAESQM